MQSGKDLVSLDYQLLTVRTLSINHNCLLVLQTQQPQQTPAVTAAAFSAAPRTAVLSFGRSREGETMSKRYHVLYLCLLIACIALACLVFPWVGSVPAVLVFLVGTHAVFDIRKRIVEHLGCSNTAAASMAIGIVDMLVSNADENQASMPAFITIGKNGRDIRELYQDQGFKSMCAIVRAIGPVPCYPACLLLQGQGR
jgi:hypothetical protein